MKPYMIRDWQLHYENNRSKELKVMTWVPVPVKLSGDGYTQIMAEPDGPALFGTWIALVELAAMSQQRGTLMRGDGRPHDASSISRITRIPLALVERALFFFDETLDWLDSGDFSTQPMRDSRTNPAPIPHEGATPPAVIPALKETDRHVINKETSKETDNCAASPPAPPALLHSPVKAEKRVKKADQITPECREVLDYLQAANGGKRPYTDPGEVGGVLARKQGTVEDCKLVIDWWAAKAKAGAAPGSPYNPADYFNQRAPFWPSKFIDNLNLATRWQAAGCPPISHGAARGGFKSPNANMPDPALNIPKDKLL